MLTVSYCDKCIVAPALYFRYLLSAIAYNIVKQDQFTSGFVGVNPNSKIPAAYDYDTPSGEPIRIFESVAIMLYLAEKYDRFIFKDAANRAEMMSWLFWQAGGQGPMTGNYGHFFVSYTCRYYSGVYICDSYMIPCVLHCDPGICS